MPPGLGSSVASVASQRVSLRASVKNSNTVSGVAPMWISRTMGSAMSIMLPARGARSLGLVMVSAPLLLLGFVPQCLEPRVPELLEEGPKLLEPLGPGPVQATGPFPPLDQQA